MEPLRYQKPQYHQRQVNTVVLPNAGLGQCLVQKGLWEEFLEAGRKRAEIGFREVGRERECGSCLKSQDSQSC
jgi:hypothetical protein